MNLPDFLMEAPFGEIRLTGHRIGLYHVIYYHNDGLTPEQLHEQFPTLELELIHKVLAFYRDNQAEVDAYVARCTSEMEQRRREGKTLDLEELRQRARARGIDVEALERRIEAACREENR
jgi:uncharacterized protein (DUF433 family)